MRKIITVVLLIAAITVPFMAFDILPSIGDPNSVPNSHVSDYYIENAVSECNAPNMVTAVIVDYRAFDTMFETTVMFLAGIAVVLILSGKQKNHKTDEGLFDRNPDKSDVPLYETINKDVVISVTEPLILIYAIYILFHGEVSLGGGFQAGALIGMVYLLDLMVAKRKRPLFYLNEYQSAAAAGIGPLIYAVTGLLCIAGGGLYLQYNSLPIPVHEAELHSIGMTLVEIGVAIGVAGTIRVILNALNDRIHFDDDEF